VFLAQPKIWLLDEPTASLDSASEQRVFDAIRSHVKPNDILLISTHRPLLALQLANRAVVLEKGRVVKDGTPRDMFPALMNSMPAAPGGGRRKSPGAPAEGTIDAV
jgi:ATP-binding cassette subfamily C protein LapB